MAETINKTVIITGASSGIGKAAALELSNIYDYVVITSFHNPDKLHEVKTMVENNGTSCLSYVGDIGDFDFVKTMINDVISKTGRIDALINNAAISYVGLLTDMTKSQWDCIISTNLTSIYNTCNLAVPHMVHEKSGKIINISSMWGSVGASCEVAYSATKGGVDAFTKALAKELAPSNIQVNAIACGVVDTPMNACFSKEDLDALCEEIPAGRISTPEEIALCIKNVLEAPSYMTAQIIGVNGGFI